MNCPTAIAEILLEILQTGLLRIRALGWENDAAACAREADHLHNLPTLLTAYTPELLLYYWNVERPNFAERRDRASLEGFAPLWDRLEKLLPTANGVSPVNRSVTSAVSPPPPG